MLDVNLDPRAVRRKQVDRHPSRLPDQPGASALGAQLRLDHGLLGLAGPSLRIAHRQQQALRRLARLHPPDARPAQSDAHTELAARSKLTLDLAVPLRE